MARIRACIGDCVYAKVVGTDESRIGLFSIDCGDGTIQIENELGTYRCIKDTAGVIDDVSMENLPLLKRLRELALSFQASGDSEFKQLLDILKRLGIKHEIHWGPTRETWQKVISDAGYHIAALACTVIEIGDEEHLFSTGQADWDKKENGYGPMGVYLLRKNKKTGQIETRQQYDAYDAEGRETSLQGLDALEATYPDYRWQE